MEKVPLPAALTVMSVEYLLACRHGPCLWSKDVQFSLKAVSFRTAAHIFKDNASTSARQWTPAMTGLVG